MIAPRTFNLMVELQTAPLDAVFHALGNSTRRRMLRELAERRADGGAAGGAVRDLARGRVQAHQGVGEGRNDPSRGARPHPCLPPRPWTARSGHEWLSFYERFWTARLDALKRVALKTTTTIDPSRPKETTDDRPRALDAYGALTEPATLTIQRLLPGPIERVWAYLTDSDLRRQWLAAGEMELKVGAPFESSGATTNSPIRPARVRPASAPSTVCRAGSPSSTRRASSPSPGARAAAFRSSSADSGRPGAADARPSPRGRARNAAQRQRRLARAPRLAVARTTGKTPGPFWDGLRRLQSEYDRRLPV